MDKCHLTMNSQCLNLSIFNKHSVVFELFPKLMTYFQLVTFFSSIPLNDLNYVNLKYGRIQGDVEIENNILAYVILLFIYILFCFPTDFH